MGIITKIFGTRNDRELKRLSQTLAEVNAWEPKVKELTDEQLTARARELTSAIRAAADGLEDEKEISEALFAAEREALPEVFALTREASVRTLGMRPFDVQVVGGIALWEGKITEMKTGEGKTLVATMPLTLHAMGGRGAHLVTVNDYLAKRDSEWMGPIYRMMGLEVGLIVHGLTSEQRRKSYHADIAYGTNNEFGFDYLRDNMKVHAGQLVQRGHYFAIVDEVDSILIDEARTPLIISGPVQDDPRALMRVRDVVRRLTPAEHFEVEEKHRNVMLTDLGVTAVEEGLGIENLYDDSQADNLYMVENMVRAYALYKRDRHYIVKGREVILIDEHTGRTMPGRRLSEGLHQAIEAKENVRVKAESQTYATISLQNYFRMYARLAGMTGTADTEAMEFKKIYDLEVLVIPTNVPMVRNDQPDKVYLTADEKFAGVYEDILDCYMRGQPVLVGTTSIDMNEMLADLLNNNRKVKRIREILDRPLIEQAFAHWSEQLGKELDPKTFKIPHTVLNAKVHQAEALVVAQGGRHKAVTIATNMAGRGTDIKLGGDPEALVLTEENISREHHPKQFERAVAARLESCREEKKQVVALGGLRVIGTERHESRRIDNQLRGRSGRQGDPGSSTFYLSLEDDLLRIFGSGTQGILARLQVEKDQPIVSHRLMDRAIERAQKAVETHNFDIRKRLIEYDDVMNTQRKVIYTLRHDALMEKDIHQQLLEFAYETGGGLVISYTTDLGAPEQWDLKGLSRILKARYNIERQWTDEDTFHTNAQELAEEMGQEVRERLAGWLERIRELDAERYRLIEESPIDREKLLHIMLEQAAFYHADRHAPPGLPAGKWPFDKLDRLLHERYGVTLALDEEARRGMNLEHLGELIKQVLETALAADRPAMEGKIRAAWEETKVEKQRRLVGTAEQRLLLWALDHHWMKHLWRMDHLRDAVRYRGYAQRDPLIEYKRDGFAMFQDMLGEIKKTAVNALFHLVYEQRTGRLRLPDMQDLSDEANAVKEQSDNVYRQERAQQQAGDGAGGPAKQRPVKREAPKVGRNDPCPCGSGKKYKKCCWEKDHRLTG